MKTKHLKLMCFTFLLAAVMFQLFTVCVFAQDVTNGAPVPILPGAGADAAAGAFTALIGALTAKYGVILTVIAWIGILRAVFKPLMSFVESVVKATPGKADDAAIAHFETGPVYKWLIWSLDWLASIKPPAGPTTNPMLKE